MIETPTPMVLGTGYRTAKISGLKYQNRVSVLIPCSDDPAPARRFSQFSSKLLGSEENRMNTVPYSAFSGQFTRFEARLVSPGIGAELLGTDLANPTDTRVQEDRAALLAYLVVFFRNQDFSRPNSH
jgi:hypothetical protein